MTVAAAVGNSTVNELQDLMAQACNGGISADALNACSNVSYSATADIPDLMGNPPNHHGISDVDNAIACFESIYGNRTIGIEGNAPISGANLVFEGYDGSPTGDNYAWYSLTWTSASTDIVIKVAPRAAVGFGICGYGSCFGAARINGGPYHFMLDLLDGKSLGRRDNQLMVEELECNLNIPVVFGTPTANDNCVGSVTPVITVNDAVSPVNNGIQHCRTWEASDNCGNTSQCTQCIRITCSNVANNSDGDRSIVPANETEGLSFNAYPNPFKSTVTIEFSSNITSQTLVEVYSMEGRKVATLWNGTTEGGASYKTEFNAAGLGDGIYMYRITSADRIINGKLTLIK